MGKRTANSKKRRAINSKVTACGEKSIRGCGLTAASLATAFLARLLKSAPLFNLGVERAAGREATFSLAAGKATASRGRVLIKTPVKTATFSKGGPPFKVAPRV